MALPSSGQISFSDINIELGRLFNSTIGLRDAAIGNYTAINANSSIRPSGIAPHSISEFRGYDHQAGFGGGGGGKLQQIPLGFSDSDSRAACSERTSTYYANTTTFSSITELYLDDSGRDAAKEGYYSDGSVAGYWDGRRMDAQGFC
jgi:hypothetical protein